MLIAQCNEYPDESRHSMPQVLPIFECKVLVLALALTEFPAILLENFVVSKVQIIDDFLWKNPFFPYSMT